MTDETNGSRVGERCLRPEVAALLASRLTWGTHTDRWGDVVWQREFWTEAADIVLAATPDADDASDVAPSGCLNCLGGAGKCEGCPANAYPRRAPGCDLIDRSSLGAPEAKALRESVSDETAARIVALARDLEAASPDADDASTGASEGLSVADVVRLGEAVLTDDNGVAIGFDHSVVERIVAARESAAATRARAEALREVADAQKCGGCKGEGSHRRHCPRHPKYHPWIPLADRAEGIGDSIGVPELANQAWALAGAIRREMPNHPFRPARLQDRA